MRQRKTRWPDLRIRHYGAPYDDSTGGNFARTGIPDALSSATYNANNQVTQRGGTSFSYDQNGNLTADAGKTYNWNGRNELVSVSGAVSASLRDLQSSEILARPYLNALCSNTHCEEAMRSCARIAAARVVGASS